MSIVKFLVNKGLNPDLKDNYNRKAIEDAAINGHFEIVSFLKDKTT